MRKVKILLSFLMLAAVFPLCVACAKTEDVIVTKYPHYWTTVSNSLIAHGGGALGGLPALNVKEAIIKNYNAGHRVFEIDLNLTTDGRLAAVHDWPSYKGPLSSADFSKVLIADVYPSMELKDICSLMMEYRDMYIITDTKSFEYEDAQITEQFNELYEVCKRYDLNLLNRIIPQIYNQEMYDTITKIYPFRSIIYTLYESPDTDLEVVEFVKDREEIKVITMSPVRLSNDFVRALKEHRKMIYCFTINDLEEMKSCILKGVTGFYTDFVLPSDHFYENMNIN